MDFSGISRMDSSILLGIVNEKLRLECNSFEELIVTYELDAQAVHHKLERLGYRYDPLTNQFKASR
jgi:hypothetical protein